MPNANAIPADGLPNPQRMWAFLAILLSVTLAVLDGSIANVALPTMAVELKATPSASIWIVNAYQLAVVVSLLPLASLGEIYGYRRIYVGGVVVFTVASAACAISTSLPILIGARVVQGVGGAGIMGLNIAIVRHIFPKARLGEALGWNTMVVATGATIGPTIAGVILTSLSWPWLFAINIPLGLFAAVVGVRNLPLTDRAARKFDGLGALLTAAAIGLLITAIDGAAHGIPGPFIVLQLAVGIGAGAWLTRRSLRQTAPLLPLDLLRRPIFALSIATSIASFAAQMLAFTAVPFLFQGEFGFTPVQIGFFMMPWPLATGIAAPIAGRLSDRYPPGILRAVGLTMLAVGIAALSQLSPLATTLDVVWRMALCGAGFGIFQTPNNRTLINSAPRPRSGAASGMLGTARLTGQATGAAMLALTLARYGGHGSIVALHIAAGLSVAAACISMARMGGVARAPSSIDPPMIDLQAIPAPDAKPDPSPHG